MTEPNAKRLPQAFISSTFQDLREHRAAAVDACLRVGVVPIMRETARPSDTAPQLQSLDILDQADIYIGILAWRYGFVPPGQEKSLTELEYERAVELDIPCLIFIMSGDHTVRFVDVEAGPNAAKLEAFKAVIRRRNVVSEFRSADELKVAIVTSLVNVLGNSTKKNEAPVAFLLLPFSEGFEHLRHFLSSELLREGIQVFRIDRMQPRDSWINTVSDAIRGADFVIADITGANPNVMYELGHVHSLRKPTIMLVESDALKSVPYDLQGYLFLTYNKNDLESLRKPLARFLHEYAKEGRR